MLAQPEVRAYYNKFEWAGVAGGYQVNRWRYELSASWHQRELIGPHASGHPDSVINGFIQYPVFEDDVWTESTTTITGRILRTGRDFRPKFEWYYGIYFRYIAENSELTEANWSAMEHDMATRYAAIMSDDSWRIGTGLVLGARGTIAGGVFCDVNASILPFIYGKQHWYYSNGFVDTHLWTGATYLAEDPALFFQIGLGYKFVAAKR